MNKKQTQWLIWIVSLSGLLCAAALLSLSVGSSSIALKDIIPTMVKGSGTIEYAILFNIRLPRIILGFAVGGALSLAGVILQGMFRNPLVEPYTLGISGGAALGVCITIVFKLQRLFGVYSLPVFGFAGALITLMLVYSLSVKRGIAKVQGFLLTGVMISFISSSLIMLLMAIARVEDLQGIVFWTMGSLEEPSRTLITIAVAGAVTGLAISYFFALQLNAFALGEEQATHLGINTERTKRILFFLASFLTGCSVAISGIIGFVGLVVPHFMRLFVGSDHRILLISSFLCGSVFLILCDTLARTVVAPMELPVGVITGIVGGVLFVYALAGRGKGRSHA